MSLLPLPPLPPPPPPPPTFYVLSICWNEEFFLPYFLKHYSFATKIIIFDNMSSDNSVAIMKQHPNVEIATYNTNEQIRDDIYLEIKNHAWKQYKHLCDWIIIVDIDELIHHPLGIPAFVQSLPPNVGIAKCKGYEMFSPGLSPYSPDENMSIFQKCATGMPGVKLDKCTLLNTKMVQDMNYLTGCHQAYPKMTRPTFITYTHPQFVLLHYKFIHPLPQMIHRYKQMARRLSQQNLLNGWGFHYTNIKSLTTKYYALLRGSAFL